MTHVRSILAATLVCAGTFSYAAAQAVPAPGSSFLVRLDPAATAPVSGRVLVFAKKGAGDKEVSAAEFTPEDVWVGALEVHDLAPGATVRIDTATGGGATVFPRSLGEMPPGAYEAQAVLDTDHTYNYSGRGPQDWISPVVAVSSAGTMLLLNGHPEAAPARAARRAKVLERVKPGEVELVQMESPALTRFWGTPTFVQAYVILPPGYAAHPAEHYPTAYYTAGFGGGLVSGLAQGIELRKRMLAGTMPPMIWVMLDESCAHGTHEFADSVNNGPWGQALTAEYIPMLERRYHMDARPTGRFLNGHSSGGWATLQLQVNYPQVFGGTWSTSPDSSDFHNFTGPNLYAPGANVYTQPDGKPYPIMRDDGKIVSYLKQFAQVEQVLGPYGGQFSSFDWVFSPRGEDGAPMPMFDRATGANVYTQPDGKPYPIMRDDGKVVSYLKQFAQVEQVLGPYGGQFSSFDWVFSPRGEDGAPMPMFDRATGAVDPRVVAYWGEHYDLANITERTWPERGAMLRGRIHLTVGTADTFYLDGAAHLFEARLQKLGAEPHFTYLPGRTHFDLYKVGNDEQGLLVQIAREMYAVARPGVAWKH